MRWFSRWVIVIDHSGFNLTNVRNVRPRFATPGNRFRAYELGITYVLEWQAEKDVPMAQSDALANICDRI